MNRKNKIAKLDQLWRDGVKERDGHICQWQQEGCLGKGTDAHHVYYCRHQGTRFMLANGVTLCIVCHAKAHSNKEQFMEWWTNRIGPEKAEVIRQESLRVSKYLDYDAIERGLKEWTIMD